jgi:hypothetical protein
VSGLFLTNNVVFIAINGLVGLSLAPLGWMATLPVMGYVVGGRDFDQSCGEDPVPLRAAHLVPAGAAGGPAVRAAVRLCRLEPQLLVAVHRDGGGGLLQRQWQLYRFAAAELSVPAFREKAVSLVMAGGLIGAVIGPNLAARTRGLTEAPFAGAYLSLAVVALLAMALMAFVQFPPVPPRAAGAPAGRPLSQIMRQPVFVVAAVSAALSYGVMNLLMAATPLAMQVCGFLLPTPRWCWSGT